VFILGSLHCNFLLFCCCTSKELIIFVKLRHPFQSIFCLINLEYPELFNRYILFLFEVKNLLIHPLHEHWCRFSASQELVQKVQPSGSTLSNTKKIHQKLEEILKMHLLLLYYPISHLLFIVHHPSHRLLRLIFMGLFAGGSCSWSF
jgi:hypothetical protein